MKGWFVSFFFHYFSKVELFDNGVAVRRSRGWCFTLNNYSSEDYEFAKDVVSRSCRYLVVGKEEAPTTGTPHLQGYIYFDNGKSLAAVRRIFPRAHFLAARGDAKANREYCSKGGEFFEHGTCPASQEEKGRRGREAAAERWALAKAGSFEQLPPESIKTYEYIHAKFGLAPKDLEEIDNLWIFGPTGCGKSRYVRENFVSFYSKPMSKWWDGYSGEEVVVLDDFDPSHGKFLGYFLKIWADRYVFNAEVKGGMLKIRPKRVIVTSQYILSACFEDRECIDAIARRFKLIDMN